MSDELPRNVTVALVGGPRDGMRLTVEGLVPPDRLSAATGHPGTYRRLRETGRHQWLYRWVERSHGTI